MKIPPKREINDRVINNNFEVVSHESLKLVNLSTQAKLESKEVKHDSRSNIAFRIESNIRAAVRALGTYLFAPKRTSLVIANAMIAIKKVSFSLTF